MRETAAPKRNRRMYPYVDNPRHRERGPGPPITSLSDTSSNYLPNPSATISDSSIKWGRPLWAAPVVPEVEQQHENVHTVALDRSHWSGFFSGPRTDVPFARNLVLVAAHDDDRLCEL